MSRLRPQNCPLCGNKYIYIDLHWINCPANPEAKNKGNDLITDSSEANTRPSESPTLPTPTENTDIDEILVGLFSKAGYLLNSDAAEAIIEAKAAITKKQTARVIAELQEILRISGTEYLSDKDISLTEHHIMNRLAELQASKEGK